MKIALCCKVYPTSRPGGMGFVCQDRARALTKLGHEVHVLTTGKTTHGGELLLDRDVEVHHMPCKPSHYSTEFAQHCEGHCRYFQPHILHSDSFDVNRPWQVGYKGSVITATTLHGCCWGAYFTELNMWMRHGGSCPQVDTLGTAKERRIISGLDKVIGISRHEHWILTNLLGAYGAKLVYNPLPDYFFRNIKQELPQGRRKFLCAAVSGHRQRGFAIAEKAAKEADVSLVIAEDIPRDRMPELIDSCHGLVLPTCYAQGMDLAVGEAIARRRPVFATSTGSYQRECEQGGIYYGAIKLIPLSGDGLADMLSDTLDWADYRSVCDYLHGSTTHAEKWLEAILS
jgi:glycosyltransferase involved in cell wall biosynthesis